MIKKGLILINAYSRLESSLNQSKRLKEEFRGLGIDADIRRNNFFPGIVEDGNIRTGIDGYGFCIYLDKDKYVSEMLEKSGLRLFNTHAAIRACDDKMVTYIRLSGQGILMPKTLPGLLCYDASETVPEETLARIERELDYPVIVKESYGSLGAGVYKVGNRAELADKLDELKTEPHLIQQTVATSFGRDVRAVVIGGKLRAAMLRQSNGDFRSNIELGGSGSAFECPKSFVDTAEIAAKTLGLDYCGVDLMFGEGGVPVVCEVNSNAFFGGIEGVTGRNIAREYAEYILSAL